MAGETGPSSSCEIARAGRTQSSSAAVAHAGPIPFGWGGSLLLLPQYILRPVSQQVIERNQALML